VHVPIGPNNKFEPGMPIAVSRRISFHGETGMCSAHVPSRFRQQRARVAVTANGRRGARTPRFKPDYAYDGKAIYLNNSGYTMVGRASRTKRQRDDRG